MPRWAARTDTTQRPIVDALRSVGALVLPLHVVGKGCPDLLCYYRGRLYLLELKSRGGTLTPWEREFRDAGWPVIVAFSVEEALRGIGAMG